MLAAKLLRLTAHVAQLAPDGAVPRDIRLMQAETERAARCGRSQDLRAGRDV
jgi:hypothetical protein